MIIIILIRLPSYPPLPTQIVAAVVHFAYSILACTLCAGVINKIILIQAFLKLTVPENMLNLRRWRSIGGWGWWLICRYVMLIKIVSYKLTFKSTYSSIFCKNKITERYSLLTSVGCDYTLYVNWLQKRCTVLSSSLVGLFVFLQISSTKWVLVYAEWGNELSGARYDDTEFNTTRLQWSSA